MLICYWWHVVHIIIKSNCTRDDVFNIISNNTAALTAVVYVWVILQNSKSAFFVFSCYWLIVMIVIDIHISPWYCPIRLLIVTVTSDTCQYIIVVYQNNGVGHEKRHCRTRLYRVVRCYTVDRFISYFFFFYSC